MYKIGDKVRFVPASGFMYADDTDKRRAVTGTVYYVNAAHRHFGVEAEVGSRGYTIRESFKF